MINSYPWCIIFIINTWTLKSVLPDCVWLRDKHRVLIRHRFQWTRKALGGWWRVTTWQLWLSYITCYLWRWLLPYTYNRICKGTILSNDRHLEHTHTHTHSESWVCTLSWADVKWRLSSCLSHTDFGPALQHIDLSSSPDKVYFLESIHTLWIKWQRRLNDIVTCKKLFTVFRRNKARDFCEPKG